MRASNQTTADTHMRGAVSPDSAEEAQTKGGKGGVSDMAAGGGKKKGEGAMEKQDQEPSEKKEEKAGEKGGASYVFSLDTVLFQRLSCSVLF